MYCTANPSWFIFLPINNSISFVEIKNLVTIYLAETAHKYPQITETYFARLPEM